MAAEIVEVRVGRHAEFTRIVFELDRAAGYRIERANPSPGVSELVVSLEATSIPRRIRSSKSLIEQVEVEPSGARSVARVRLAKGGLRLKEMILASPPRIVLDVLSDEPVARDTSSAGSAGSAGSTSGTSAAAKQSSTPSTSTSTSTTTSGAASGATADRGSAGTRTATTTATKPAAATPTSTSTPTKKSASKTVASTSAADRVVAKVDAKTDGETGASADAPAGSSSSDSDATADARQKALAEASRAADAEEPSGAMKILQEREEALARAAREPSTSTRVERPAAKSDARPMVAKKTAKDEDGGWMTWAMAAAGAVVLLLGGLVFWRRRQGGEEVVFDDDEASQDDAPIEFGRSPSSASAESDNPFAGLMDDEDEQLTLGAQDETPSSTTGNGGDAFAFGHAGDGEEEKEVEEMEMISRDAVNESLGGMPSAMGGGSEEFQQMMREMNRRVEALEGRIDELVDARDRLERQVAAQTEELRVQRAAIARTQRAVRNLARPEDEPEATEPALREPNPPGGE
jgi:LPXTG-motif cell wall-anchored protein